MNDLLSFFPAGKKSSSGWISFNGPCCVHNGETADRRKRGGLKERDNGWSYHCFNCGYTASFTLGRNLGFKARRLLEWLGVDTVEIDRLNLESMRYRTMADIVQQRSSAPRRSFDFAARDLPEGVTALSTTAAEYLTNRGIAPDEYPYQSITSNGREGVVIPFTHRDAVVGSSIRFMDKRIPKYINDKPQGYVFGVDLQPDNWESVIVTEGVFDALSIGGVALLHDDVNDAQAELINSLKREVIVVPDQDTAGVKLIDRAVELGWSVSIPEWPAACKDVNDAVARYGAAATAIAILHNRNSSRIKIELAKKSLVRRIT